MTINGEKNAPTIDHEFVTSPFNLAHESHSRFRVEMVGDTIPRYTFDDVAVGLRLTSDSARLPGHLCRFE